MATTSLFVEILIAGLLAVAWIALISLRLLGVDVSTLQSSLLKDSSSALLIGFGFVVAYQVGVIVNLFAYWALYAVREFDWRRRAVSKAGVDSFEQMRIAVFQKGSEPVVQGLLSSLHFARLGRTGIFNFLLLAVALFAYDDRMRVLAGISLILALGSVPVWIMQGRRYYRRVGVAYQEFCKTEREANDCERPYVKCETGPLPPNPGPQPDVTAGAVPRG
jgi:hypothetical protein